MAAEPGNRYHHLLQPIRDLSKVWNIEIAEELEKYIAEVASLEFSTGAGKVNFAEAALLIQGSTAIYSRKVEQLYALVYQALGQICESKEKHGDGQGKKKVPTGLWSQVPETEELLTIGHLIKEGRNITLEEASLQRREQKQALHRRLPLFLMPKDRRDSKQEFRLSSCTLHRSGVYLIQESDSRLVDELLGSQQLNEGSPLAPPPPGDMRDLDEQLRDLLCGGGKANGEASDGNRAGDASFEFDAFDAPEAPDLGFDDGADGAGLQSLLRPGETSPANADPWALLDEDEVVGQDVPLEVASCTKRFGTKGLLATGVGLPTAGTKELSDAEMWRPGHAAEGLPAFMAAGHPVESLFLVVGTHLRNGGRTETEKAGFSAAWLEFEDLFQAASKRRKIDASEAAKKAQQAKLLGTEGPAPLTPQYGQGADSDDEGNAMAFTPPRASSAEASQITPLKEGPALFDEEQRSAVARLEGLIEDAQNQYERSVRGKLQLMQGSLDQGSKYPELYENVRRWQEQLQPVLKECESHPEFDINGYGAKLLGKMVSVDKSLQEEEPGAQAIPFSRLVHGQPGWEVCRRFLTCLILTNQGNTEILLDEAEGQVNNNFRLKLLKEEVSHLSLNAEEEPEVLLSKPLADTPRSNPGRMSIADAPTPLRARGVKRAREAGLA